MKCYHCKSTILLYLKDKTLLGYEQYRCHDVTATLDSIGYNILAVFYNIQKYIEYIGEFKANTVCSKIHM